MSSVSFRIVSLPFELQTNDDVAWYVDKTLNIGTVNSINITQNVAPNGARFRSANVTVSDCRDTPLYDNLIDANRNGVMVNSYWHDDNGNVVQFHFDNGKPMLHLKLVVTDAPEPYLDVSTVPSLDVTNSWSSIYIPVIPSDLAFDERTLDAYDLQTEDGLKRFFETKMCLGTVSRVDFVTKTIADSTSTVRSAYIHFDSWADIPTSHHVRQQIDCGGEFFVKGHYEGFEFFRFRNRRFMVLKVNRSPIPEANPEANVHQLAARNAELETKVVELEAQVADLKSKLIAFDEMTALLRIKNKTVDAQMDVMLTQMMANEA
jgi:hypothetical protein